MLLKGEVENPLAYAPESYSWRHGTQFGLGYMLEHQHVRIDFTVMIEATSEEVEEFNAEAKYLYSVLYKVENLEELVQQKDDQMEAHPALIISLLAITYSTIRGNLLQDYKERHSKVILPIIDPMELIKIILRPKLIGINKYYVLL